MIELEEISINESLLDEEDDYTKFCHIVCVCSPKITLCGGFKSKLCGGKVRSFSDLSPCEVCGKFICLDCVESFQKYDCPRCGN